MKKEIKKKLRKAFYNCYKPYIVRKEKIKATILWRRGVRDCNREFRRLNGPRFYLWFDENTMSFVPMTMNPSVKGESVSMSELQRTHKIKARRKMKIEDMKRECFYYTPSRWGAIGCSDDNALRVEKYHKWLRFYMSHLSLPIRKLNAYRP